jgi:diguanylate cyclase (GGDEF)-like protein
MTSERATSAISLSADTVNNRRRLRSIEDLGLLNRAGDPVLTGLTRVACYITGAEAAAVHIIDREFEHRIAATGAPLGVQPAADTMCRHVVAGGNAIIVADATQDERLVGAAVNFDPDNPIRFYAGVPLRVGTGSVVGTICAFDSTARRLNPRQMDLLISLADLGTTHVELVRMAADLGEAAVTDQLTGAVNRTMFHDRLATALARRRRRGTEVLVAMLDVDDFKQVNDTYGHGRGDDVLRWVVDQLVAVTRAEDTVGRLGGDEFAIVAEILDPPDPLLERIAVALTAEGAPVTVTVGAVVAAPDDDVRSALMRADHAMYDAKRSRQSS